MESHDEHYLRGVLALGDKRSVVTTIAIYFHTIMFASRIDD